MRNTRFLTLAGVLVASLMTCAFVLSAKDGGNAGQPTTAVLPTVAAMAKDAHAGTNEAPAGSAPQRERLDAPVQVVRFTLYDAGIYPGEARVQPGLVTISIEDLSGANSGLIVERVESNVRTQIGSVNRRANRLRAKGEMLLTPGRYEVHAASQRNNRATLIVEP